MSDEILLEVEDLVTELDTERGTIAAVDGVSFTIGAGEAVGLVGESGCGKTTTAQSLLRLIPPETGRIARGSVRFRGRDLREASEAELRSVRGAGIAMIFQDPLSALVPVVTVGAQLEQAIRLRGHRAPADVRERALALCRQVAIPAPEEHLRRYPHQLSGGLRQRLLLALALAGEPALLIADEPTASLDATLQAQVLQLLGDLRARLSMALLLISHDLGVVAESCDHVMVMYAGRIVERGPVDVLFRRPRHPYTSALLKARPGGERLRRLPEIPGVAPPPHARPPGCRFHDRCAAVQERCRREEPALARLGDGLVRCHFPIEEGA